MRDVPVELELPLGGGDPGDLARRRLQHLSQVAGADPHAVISLSRAFPSLASIYAATDEQLSAVVGSVAAARIRWFLDAPLDTGVSAAELPRIPRAA